MSTIQPVLPQGVGYAIVLGVGGAFALLMVLIMRIQARYSDIKTDTAAEFTSASSSVKSGLVASGVVSAWTWAATLLTSSSVAFRFGVSGPWWYAAGATVQVLLFSMNSCQLRKNAPKARTYLEVIRYRWGKLGHVTFMFFGLATNLLVTSMLITGGSATVSALTGMHTAAACALIPLPIMLYVAVGGMRASLYADYLHSVILYAMILAFLFVVYTTSERIGSPARMYELLQEASIRNPVAGNAGGSYLTMRSVSGIIFGVINLCGNFSTVYLDSAYWNRAIASEPQACVKGFLLGGTAWTAVPLAFASTLGLAARAIMNSDIWPGYPQVLTENEIGAGLPAPAAAATLMGKSGATAILFLLFLAVVSSAAAELIAVSSVLTYDVFCVYIRPGATDKEILAFDHLVIVIYGLFMGVLGIIFYYIGISMGWLYLFMGVLLGGGVFPVALSILSANANRLGCIIGAWTGLIAGITAWLVTASTLNNGELSISTTFQDYPMLAGNLTSIGTSAIISLTTTWLWPAHFDWTVTRAIRAEPHVGDSSIVEGQNEVTNEEKKKGDLTPGLRSARESIAEVEVKPPVSSASTTADLNKAFKMAFVCSVSLFVVLMLLIPLPLFFSSHVYTKDGFTAWIATCFVWTGYSTAAIVFFPLWEYRVALRALGKSMLLDVFRSRRRDDKDRSTA